MRKPARRCCSACESSTARLIEGVQAAKAAQVAKDHDEAIDFLVGRSFSKKWRSTSSRPSAPRKAASPVQPGTSRTGITALACTYPDDADDRLTIQLEAGKILDKVA